MRILAFALYTATTFRSSLCLGCLAISPRPPQRRYLAMTTTSPKAPSVPDKTSNHVSEMRVSYSDAGLPSAALEAAEDPFALFDMWMSDAVDNKEPEPNAMCLATVSTEGRPAARYVLLKGVDNSGFVWYTNYNSRKGHHLDSNPAAALTFWWPLREL
jgi:hypothetical protein